MFDGLQALSGGLPSAFAVRGEAFPWVLYLPGLTIGVLGAWRALQHPRQRGGP